MANYFTITGYWKDDKSEFSGIVKDTNDVIEEEDDNIFFYGLSEEDIEDAIKNGKKFSEDFVITDYLKHKN